MRIQDYVCFSPESPYEEIELNDREQVVEAFEDRVTGFYLSPARLLADEGQRASFCNNFRLVKPWVGVLVLLHLNHLNKTQRMLSYQNVAANGIGNLQARRLVETESIVLPDDELARQMTVFLYDLVGMSLELAAKNANLRQTRGLLLPCLVSGELDVSELDIDTGRLDL